MNKRITRLAAMIAVGLLANTIFAVGADSYLYWMVDPSVYGEYTYDYATVKIDGSTSYLHMYDPGEDIILDSDAGAKLARGDSGYFGAFDAASMSGASGASFLIELWSSAGAESIATATLAYSAALAGGAIYTPGKSGGGTAYVVTGFVPEPTSGLLLLLGMAGLALRRKYVV